MTAFACARPAPQVDTRADVAAINAVREREVALASTGDTDSLLAVYASDVHWMPPNEPAAHGEEALKKSWDAMLRQVTLNVRYTGSEVSVSGDWAVDRYTGVITATPKAGGNPIEEQIKGVHIMKRQPDGTWRIAQDVWNSDAPLSPSPPRSAKTAQAPDPVIGTWKLNVVKSKNDPGPPPTAGGNKYAAVSQGVRVIGLDANGKPTGPGFVCNYDGKDCPVPGNAVYDTVAWKRIDAYTLEGTRRKAGKVIQTFTRVIARDGKTMTIATQGVNEKGQSINNVAVLEKQ